ncbi:MAG TPA: multicopper oxidase domain-containing protein [Desertimonas sp.]|nr:multicopper oxidase domain-containing protein [Desertimonas sp.]
MNARVARLTGVVLGLAVLGSLVVGIPASAKTGAPTLRAVPAKSAAKQAVVPAAVLADIDLCAKVNPAWNIVGSTTVPIWGFVLDDGTCSGDAQLPGPTLGVDTPPIAAGDTVTINLTNVDVPENVSVVIPGLASSNPPDTGGVAAGGSASYTFTATGPGTYLYESGAQSDAGQVGLPMGLYGAAVVRSTTAGQAYDEAWTAYDSEDVLVLSEIDPALNADPAGSGCSGGKDNCHLLDYHPTYWLINGKAYPDTAPISASSGDRLLVRYLNAGSFHHGMELLGAHQRVIAKDAFAGYPYQVVAETIPSGSTLDAITTPCVLAGDDQIPLANANMHLTNVNASPGGMLTFLNLTGTDCPAAANIAPLVDAGPSASVNLPSTELDGTVRDDFVTPVSVSWTMQSGPGTVTFGDPSSVDTTASFSTHGTYVLQLTADDGVNAPVSDVVTLTVVNPPPSVNAGPDQTVAFPGPANLDGTVTDDGVTTLTTLWTKQSGPGTVTFGNAGLVDTTATFSLAGTYVLRLTANDGINAPVFDEVTITIPPPTLLYLSTVGNVNVGGLGSADDADIYAWKGGTTYSRFFDASANGVPAAADVDAFAVVDSDTFYLSFGDATTLPGVGAITSQDVVKFDAGTWSMFFDGSDVGLTATAENVDAFEILSGTLVAVSTTGNPDVPGITGEADEDLLQCTGTSFGLDTVCTWSYYFEGSDVDLSAGPENVDGAAVVGANLYLSTTGNFTVTGLSGANEDVFTCNGGSRGAATTCTSFSLFFDGSANGITDNLDAIDRP